MTIDEVVLLLRASLSNSLTPLQEMVLRSSWEGKTYTNIAINAHYGEERVRKVASLLWQLLSEFSPEPIHKSNFRQILENQRLTPSQESLIQEYHRMYHAASLEFPSGPVSLNSPFYIHRPPVEDLATEEISKPGSVISIQGSKKMGKSSLILRIIAQAENLGYKTVSIDFQQVDTDVFSNLDRFLRWFCANMSRELGLEAKLKDFWNLEIGSKMSCSLYFQEYLLPSIENPLVLVFQEIDWLFAYPEISHNFLPLLRSWYEQGKHLHAWQKLRIVLAQTTEFFLPFPLTQSPFSIGLPLRLLPFNQQQIQELAARHGLDWSDGVKAQKLMAMVGGYPYLVRLALYHLVSKASLEYDLDSLLEKATCESGIYHEYLRQYTLILRKNPEMAAAFEEVLISNSGVKLEPAIAAKLSGLGLVNFTGDTTSSFNSAYRAFPACNLYRLYFRERLESLKSLSDIRLEKLERENQQLRFLSSLDQLTQLPNSSYFYSYLEAEWQKAIPKNNVISLILCDVDYFKIYNRTYGSIAGDECLKKIAQTINHCVSKVMIPQTLSHSHTLQSGRLPFYSNSEFQAEGDILIARYNGEKFAVLTYKDSTYSTQLAENIREQVKNLAIPCDYPGIGGLPANVLTVSIGVASIIPDEEMEATTLINTAEAALYQAKRRGRNRIFLYQ
ncbi:AAA-like domain-containing protein [Calothrix sp. 336/3]|uniref:AAA-like domain-containing protein n=1 Tax=Calothrix sp. 336/3 TaxID=1337936 RepID=UPI0004E40600|nr:AAA-like domain-containing protein [Calothrix sp. 336/3]AKG23998.1 diguanylate cyclase [Calothrix sp. 336/3]